MTVISHNQSSKISYPGKCSLYFPPAFESSQCTPILQFIFYPVRPVRSDKLDTSRFKIPSQLFGICRSIIHHALHAFTRPTSPFPRYSHFIQQRFNQRDLRWGRSVQVVPQRNSFAICHHHPLRTLSAFGLSDAEPPFLAGAKLPSANVSAHFSWPRSSSSPRNARHASSQTSRSSHSWSLRQHVDGEGYHGGKSCHRAPLRRTHNSPSKQRLSETLLRPFRCSYSGSTKNGAIFFHCLLVNSLLKRFAVRESSFDCYRRLPTASIYIRDMGKV